MSSSQNDKLKFISYLYAIGTILVVLGHSTPTSASDMPKIVDDIRSFIYCFHMPLFFFIAGFLFKYTTQKNKKPYSSFIKNKAVRFLTPYFVLSAIGIFPKILMSEFVNDMVSLDWYYIFETIFNPRLNVWGHFWFLPALLLIFVISYLIYKCCSKKISGIILLALTLALAVFPINTDWLAIKDICLELIYFCLGVCTCNYVINNKRIVFRLPIAIIAMIMSVLIFVFMSVSGYRWIEWLHNLSTVIIALLMIYSLFYFSMLLEKKGNSLLGYFDGKTFTIYIISWPCQAITEIVLNRVLHMHWYITMSGIFIVGIGVPLLFICIYKKLKWHPKFISLIFGIN